MQYVLIAGSLDLYEIQQKLTYLTDGIYCVQLIYHLTLCQNERITGQYLSGSAAANEKVTEQNAYEIFSLFLSGKLVTVLIYKCNTIEELKGFQSM